MSLLEKVEQTIIKYNLLQTNDKILIGVSGGPDSLALLHILKRLQGKYDFYLHIAHLDHMLRGKEGTADAQFVENIADKWKIPITLDRFNVKRYQKEHKMSLEQAAREVRYNFFFKLAKKLTFNKIAVGHHANDQAETVLMKFLRGAGLKGLGGIPFKKDKIIRPLIEITRPEINEYCDKHNLNPRIDSSNLESIYLRNKIRLELIPHLTQEYNQNLIETLNRTADILRAENNFLITHTKKLLDKLTISKNPQKISIRKDKLIELHLAMQRRIVRESLNYLKKDYQDFYYNHIESVLDLAITGETGSQIDLPRGVIVKLNYNKLVFTTEVTTEIDYFEYNLSLGKKQILDLEINSKVVDKDYPWQEKINDPYIACLDLSKIGSQFYLRQRKEGDRFFPLGMQGRKKLKDFFIDEKIPIARRDKIPIFTTLDDEIFWVTGLRIDDRFKVTNKTEQILIIEVKY